MKNRRVLYTDNPNRDMPDWMRWLLAFLLMIVIVAVCDLVFALPTVLFGR